MSSKKIDEKVVEMRFDNQQFERNVQTSLSTLDKLKQALHLDGASKEFEKLERASRDCDLSGLSGAVDTVKAKFSALEVMGVTALANITNSVINAGKRIVREFTLDPVTSGFQEYETQINAVQTILANTSSKGTTLEQVNKALDELNHYADKTIYNFTEMTRNIGTFTAAGVDLDTSVSAIKGIANLAAVSGSSSQQAATAMYQLSQALAAGTIKLMDWNSVVNAQMGGQVLQDAIMETARLHGIAIDQMIAKEGSFRETLKDGWLSSDIMLETLQKFTGDLTEAQLLEMGYTEEQTKAILEMGQTANDAATKVKTFTQLVDTLKEAAQSGWTETWETIVGDFEEAKGLWTEISDVLGNMINESANARNEMLSGGLDSGWNNFLSKGITDAVGFKESIVEAARAHGVAIEDIARSTDKFEDSLNQGWLTADILSDALGKLTEKTAGLSDEELASLGYTREQITELENLSQAVQDGSVSLDDYASKMARASGRDNLIQSFWNIWDSLFAIPKQTGDLVGVITVIQNAFRDIFPRTTSEQIYALTEGLRNLTERFKMSQDTADKLSRSFKGLFAVFDILGSFVKATLKTGFDLLSSVLGGINVDILGITASAGDAVMAFRDWLTENNVFVKGLSGLANGLKLGVSLAREWVERFASLPEVQSQIERVQNYFSNALTEIQKFFAGGAEKFQEFLERVRALDSINLDNIGTVLKDFRDNVLNYFVTLGGRFSSFGQMLETVKGNLLEFLTGAREGFNNLGDVMSAVDTRIRNYFGGLVSTLSGTLKKIVDFIVMLRQQIDVHLGEILTIGIGAGLIITIQKIGDALQLLATPFAAFEKVADKASDLLTNTSKAVKSFSTKLKSEAILNVAKSIAILVGSIALLTYLDQDRLLGAIEVLGILAVGLVTVSAAMGVISKMGSFQKVSLSFTALSVSLLLLATALKKMESLDGSKVWGDLGILGLMATGLTVASVAMSRLAPQLTQGSVFLLAFAASLKILISAMKDLEGLDVSGTGRAIPILIAAIGGLSLVAKACGSLKFSSAAGLLGISVSLGILIGVIQKISDLDMSGAGSNIEAFVAIFASFAGIMAASKLAGANAAKAGVGILAMSAALLLLVPAIKGLGNIDPLDMERASDAIAKLLLVFAAVTAASKFAGENAAKAGAMLLMMSGALVILSAVMVLLSHIEPEGLDRALAAVTQLELVFGALIAVTGLMKDGKEIKSTLVLLSVSLGLMAAALGALSFIEPANLQGASTSLSLVIGAFALVVAATSIAKKANSSIVVMTLAVGALAVIIGLLANVNGENSVNNARALTQLLAALAAAMVVAGQAKNVSVNAYATIGVMTLVVGALAGILGVMSYLDVTASLETSAALSLLLVSLSGACLILSGVGAVGSAVFVGIGALVTLITAVGGIMAGLGALNEYFPQTEEFLNTGLDLLIKIGQGLGSFAGSIIGGFASGLTSGLPAIGENLSDFMEGAKPFFDGVKGIDASAMTGISAMADAILTLTKADILNGISSIFGGSSSMADFGPQLVAFGASFAAYALSVKDVDADTVTASASAAKTLAEFASAIPNSGGWLAKIAGENSLSQFGQELMRFGPAFGVYAMSVRNVDPETVTASASAARSLAEFASAIPNSGGVLAKLFGENSISAFAEELMAFGPAFASYALSIDDIEPETVTASSAAAKSLAEFASAIPNSGGWLSKIVGENSISAFAEELKTFGPAFAEYAAAVKDIKPATVTASASAAQALAALAQGLPNSGGLLSLFTGNNDMSAFGTQLAAFGASFKAYYDSISGIGNIDKVNSATAGLQALVDVAKGVQGDDAFGDFASFLGSLAETRIDDFLQAFEGASDSIKKSGESLGKNLKSGITSETNGLKKIGEDGAQGFINGLRSKLGSATSAGKSLGQAAVEGTRQGLDSHSPSKEMYKVALDANSGFAEGLTKGNRQVKKASAGLANTTIDTMRDELDCHSPAKAMIEIGGNVGSGLSKGLSNGASDVKGAASKLVDAVKSGVSSVTDAVDIDAWIGKVTSKVTESAKVETQSYQETAKAAKTSSSVKTQAAKSALEAFEEYIEEEQFYGRITTEETLEQYKKVLATYKLTAEERKKVCREIYTLENQLQEESYQASMDWIEKKQYYNQMSLADELAAYKRVQSRYAKGTEQREKMDREVYRVEKEISDAQKQYIEDVQNAQTEANEKRVELEKEYADKVKEINEQLEKDIEAENQKYTDAVKSRADAIYQSYGLFDEVQKQDEVSGESLLTNLQDQVKALSSWRNILDSLSGRGVDSGLIEELQEMGPSAMAQLEALNAMSDSELDKYVDLWSVKHALATEKATAELEDLRFTTQMNIEQLRLDADRELDEYRATWQEKMDKVTSDVEAELEQLRQEFGQKIGLIRTDTEAELAEMVETGNQILREAGWDETGKQIVIGLMEALLSEKTNFIDAVTQMALDSVKAVEDTLEISSPSKVFARLGNFAGLGFVNALVGFADKSYDAGADMAGAARDGLGSSIQKIADVVANGIDTEPTIRPVLDLSNVTRGAGELNGLFNSQYSLGLAQTTSAGMNSSALIGKADVTARNDDVVEELRSLRSDMVTMTERIERMQIVLDTGRLVGEIAAPMDNALGRRSVYKGRRN